MSNHEHQRAGKYHTQNTIKILEQGNFDLKQMYTELESKKKGHGISLD